MSAPGKGLKAVNAGVIEGREAVEPSLEAYYEPRGKYWIKDGRDCWMPIDASGVKRHLRRSGFSSKHPDGPGLSPLEEELSVVELERNVIYAGRLAGYQPGLHEVCSNRILVTEGPKIPPTNQGDWSLIQEFLEGLFGDPQIHYVHGWCQSAFLALKNGDRRPGQALAIAGPPGCGKSFFQHYIVTPLLGGRQVNPYLFTTGGSNFNSEMFKAEHQLCEDEQSSSRQDKRRALQQKIKGIAVNKSHLCHAKGKEGIQLTPFWRFTISVNSEPENLMSLPIMDDSFKDKIMLLLAAKPACVESLESESDYQSFRDKLESQVPAYVWYLENEHEIPKTLQDDRYGVESFHNPQLIDALGAIAPDGQLDELIGLILFDEPRRLPSKALQLNYRSDWNPRTSIGMRSGSF